MNKVCIEALGHRKSVVSFFSLQASMKACGRIQHVITGVMEDAHVCLSMLALEYNHIFAID